MSETIEHHIVVIARWQTTEAAAGEVKALAAGLRRQSLAEPGCLGYEVLQSAELTGEFVLLERYRDQAALDAHRESDHYRTLVVERIRPLLTDRSVELLQPMPADPPRP